MYCRWFLFSAVILACKSALPPGFQDEIYCSPDSCLRAKPMRPGWSGPQLSFRECWRGSDGMISRPKAWGVKLDPQIKVDLLSNGWHTTWCADAADDSLDFAKTSSSLFDYHSMRPVDWLCYYGRSW